MISILHCNLTMQMLQSNLEIQKEPGKNQLHCQDHREEKYKPNFNVSEEMFDNENSVFERSKNGF